MSQGVRPPRLDGQQRPASESPAPRPRAQAERENSTVYLQRVPPFADLPAITPAPLVRAAPPADLDAAGEGLFADVIPDGSARALSRYTDAVDGLIRQLNDGLAAASDDARLRLREWDLPESLQARPDAAAPAHPGPAAQRLLLGSLVRPVPARACCLRCPPAASHAWLAGGA
jgi:programmed cell death 6-interacting protein